MYSLTNNPLSNAGLIEEIMYQPHWKQPVRASQREPRFFSEVSPSSYLGQTEGLVGNSNSIYEVCDSKSEKSAPIGWVKKSAQMVLSLEAIS